MSYSNTLPHRLPPSANGHHQSVQKANSMNEEEMEKYLSLSVPVLPLSSSSSSSAAAAAKLSAIKTIPIRAANKRNEINLYNDSDNYEQEVHPATTPSPVPHIAAAELHSLEREQKLLHKHHSKSMSESKAKMTRGDKIHNNYHHSHEHDYEEQHIDNNKRKNNVKKVQNVHHSSQPGPLTNRKYAEEQEYYQEKYNNNNKKHLENKQVISASSPYNNDKSNGHYHHNLYEQKLELDKEQSNTSHPSPLREKNNKNDINETMWNLRRLEAILQPTYNSTFHASTRVEQERQQELQHNNKRTNVESTFLHPKRTTPPLPSKTNTIFTNSNKNNTLMKSNDVNTPLHVNDVINNNNNNNNKLVVSSSEERVLILSEYVNKLEKEMNELSIKHAESCKLLVCFAEEREQINVITHEQETRSSIVEDETHALFDLYVLFTTVTLHRAETRWIQEMHEMHVEVKALRGDNTKSETKMINDKQEHNKDEEYDDIACKQQAFANNKREQHMPKEMNTDSKHIDAAAVVITTKAMKTSASDEAEKETVVQSLKEETSFTKDSTKNVQVRFATFVKNLCKELSISSLELSSHNLSAPSEELLDDLMLKLKERISNKEWIEESKEDKQKEVLQLRESQEASNKMMKEYFTSFMNYITLLNEMYNEYCQRKCLLANESSQLVFCVERIKLQHWHNDKEQFSEENHIALLETLKSLRLQVEQYKGALQSMNEKQKEQQQIQQMENTKNSNASRSNDSGSISLSAYSPRCVSELPYIPSRMKLHVEPANRSLHAMEMEEIRKEAIRLGARESMNVVTNTNSVSQSSKSDDCNSKSNSSYQVAKETTCQKEAIEITTKNKKEQPFKENMINKNQQQTQNQRLLQHEEEKIDSNKSKKSENNYAASAKDDTNIVNNANKESANVEEKTHEQSDTSKNKNSGSTDNKASTNNTASTITPALSVPVIKRFVAKTAHSTSSYSSYSTYSHSGSSVASRTSSYTSTVRSTNLSKHKVVNKSNNTKQQTEKVAANSANIAVKEEGNRSKRVDSEKIIEVQGVEPQELQHLEKNTKAKVNASSENEINNNNNYRKWKTNVSDEHHKELKKNNADASSYYSSSYSRSISVASSSSSLSASISSTHKNNEKKSEVIANHKVNLSAETDRADDTTKHINGNDSTLHKVDKNSNEGNNTNVQKRIASETQNTIKEADKSSNDTTKQVKKEKEITLVESKDKENDNLKLKERIEYDDSLTLDVSLTMDDSESEADNKSNDKSKINNPQKISEVHTKKTNASINSDRAQSVNYSKFTAQKVKVNSDIVADSAEKNKLKRRSSFDDDMDDQNVVNKTSASSNVSKIIANITRQNQITNLYADKSRYR